MAARAFASFSLVCRIVGRRLLVYDSFQGLPDEGQKLHVAAYSGHYGYYKEGMFCGRLEEVRENISKYGCLDVRDFVPGFFATSLSPIGGPLVLGFLDVDLVDSTRACLQYIWPRLVENGVIYSDDAGDLDVVRIF